MGCGSCGGGPKVKYQVKVAGAPVGKPVDSIAAAHALGKQSTKGSGKTYSFTAVNP
jgi:hypothetical protein